MVVSCLLGAGDAKELDGREQIGAYKTHLFLLG